MTDRLLLFRAITYPLAGLGIMWSCDWKYPPAIIFGLALILLGLWCGGTLLYDRSHE